MEASRIVALWIIAVSLAAIATASIWATWFDEAGEGEAGLVGERVIAEIADLDATLEDLAFQACQAYVTDYWQGTPVGFGVCREWHPEGASRWDRAVELGTDAP